MVEKRRGLGRGLGALISGSPSAGEDNPIEVDLPSTELPSRTASTGTETPMQSRQEQSSSAEKSPSSTSEGVGTSPEAVGSIAVSRETSSDDAKGSPSDAEVAASNESVSDTSMHGAAKSTVASPKSPVADKPARSKNKSPDSRGAPSQRQSRPVDMFFTPGRQEDEDDDDSPRETVSERRSSTSKSRRVAVPDVLGKVRNPRDEASDASGPLIAQTGDHSGALPPMEQVEADTAVEPESKSSADPSHVSRETLVTVPGATFAELSVVSIHPNRKQPRTVFDDEDMAELVHSIREVGLLQPIVVRPSDEGGDHAYELVMGERRWRAVQQAGLATIPAIVRETSDTALLRDALLENLHRSQLNPLEEAAAYQQLMQEFECTQDELSERIGRSRPQISNTIRLMRLPALVQRRVAAGVLSAGHARALLGLQDVADMERLAQRIVNEGLSVRATEEIVSLNDGLRRKTREKTPRSTARHERLDYLANSLSDHLETNVKISLGAKKGRVSIEFGSVEDLNRIMGVIAPTAEQ